MQAKDADPLRTLQGLGMVGRDVEAVDGSDWTISLFDVKVTWLCRPIQGEVPGTAVVGVAACVEDQQVALDEAHAQGFTGCGYTLAEIEQQIIDATDERGIGTSPGTGR